MRGCRGARRSGFSDSPADGCTDRVMASWVRSLPTPNKLRHHLRGWTEDEQEMLQFSSKKQINNQLDNANEDAAWWE